MEITVHGTPTPLDGKNVSIGKEAPAARITKLDGSQNVIGMISPNAQLLIAIPSLKTEVCSLGAKKFNELVKKFKKLDTIMVTTDDLDFVKDYAQKECIDCAQLVVDTERNFAKKYGLLIREGKLKDRLARAVYVVDREGIIAYKELVGEIVDEVNYEACIEAIDAILSEKKKGHTHENWMSV
ncbi:redoxin domain-containing protein [bacterium]|nr:redoxin domain-containing protein [bacterium]MBU1991372.1 redoxin domain-containing protein [bacterium]